MTYWQIGRDLQFKMAHYVGDGLQKEVKTCPGMMTLRILKAGDQGAVGKKITAL